MYKPGELTEHLNRMVASIVDMLEKDKEANTVVFIYSKVPDFYSIAGVVLAQYLSKRVGRKIGLLVEAPSALQLEGDIIVRKDADGPKQVFEEMFL